MTSSEKPGKTEELDLDRDLPLALEDMAQMEKPRLDRVDLGAYLDFLEEIRAFETETRAEKRKFYDAVFEL